MKSTWLFALLLTAGTVSYGQNIILPKQQDRWVIQSDGSIEWKIDNRVPHNDHIEMSGQKISLWMQYGVDTSKKPILNRTVVFPTFRLLPVRTTAHMMYDVKDDELPRIIINDRLYKAGVYNAAWQNDLPEKVNSIRQKGIMEIFSEINTRDGIVKLHRSFFPSVDKPMVIEKFVLTNTAKQPVKIELEYMYRETKTPPERSSGGQHSFIVSTINDGLKTVNPNDSIVFAITYQAINNKNDFVIANVDAEEQARRNRVTEMQSPLVLETPDPVLNTMYAFAKIRATESIYNTRGGLMHGPGGLRYYAAIWANDQAEYVNPFFAFFRR